VLNIFIPVTRRVKGYTRFVGKYVVVCTYIEYPLYRKYLKGKHCNTLLQCLHILKSPKWPKYEPIAMA